MKKIYLLILSILCLCSLGVFASSDDCCNKPKSAPKYEKPCPQTNTMCLSECFLCTGKPMTNAFNGMNLSSTQICNAQKLQEKYEVEVLSIEEKIQCEKDKLNELKNNCNSNSKIRKQKRVVKELEKTRKKICECYHNQFKETLSSDQKRIYNKNIK